MTTTDLRVSGAGRTPGWIASPLTTCDAGLRSRPVTNARASGRRLPPSLSETTSEGAVVQRYFLLLLLPIILFCLPVGSDDCRLYIFVCDGQGRCELVPR